ncbi:hypothetical protein [Mycolicibacterium neoaurum]|uniref:hypothetical protein n=1 Tax=Mycolicibacterium neoaurum TaxID=1795 RepID=UPI001F4D0FDA|nr:hypothetical protein [Mycolicibacterium neoaurum]
MSDGIAAIRTKKANRASRQAPPPRHPMTPGVVSQFGASRDEQVTAPAPTDDVESTAEEVSAAPASTAAPAQSAVAAAPVKAAAPSPAPQTISAPSERTLPDLQIDWADPLMHVASPTRVSVANSVASRFKAVADQPAAPPQTELIMEAISRHLADLPELVLRRRPEESGTAPAGFYVKRAPIQKAEPWQPVYMRPIAGELEALRRIVDWVNGIILAGHPGRQKTSRSEIVTAALDASYPATTRGK